MASTYTKISDQVIGNLNMKIYDVAAGAGDTYISVPTGLQNVLSAVYQQVTSDNATLVYKNSASASETQDNPGDVYIDVVGNSDNGVLIVMGN